jgi:hypothetical protein
MHDMITSGSMAAASSPGFFTQEEVRAMEAVVVASMGSETPPKTSMKKKRSRPRLVRRTTRLSRHRY